jgi:hypothetical protein
MGHVRAPAENHPRSQGVRGLLIYCSDYRCSHSIVISADRWPDDVRLSDLEPRFTCRACGRRGADVRPLFEPARMGTDALSLPAVHCGQ